MYDLIIKGGSVIDTVEKTATKADVAITNGKIAKIGLGLTGAKQIVDATGKYVCAGFFDAHIHIESTMLSPIEFAKAAVRYGTTSVIADPHEIVNVGGIPALEAFLHLSEGAAVNIFTVVPSSVPATPFDTNGAGTLTAADLAPFAEDDRVVGLGEVMCCGDVINREKDIMDKIALFKHKTVDGHASGLSGAALARYASAGIANDHECTTAAEVAQHLALGMNVYIREGSGAHSIQPILSAILGTDFPEDRFAFCTDDKHVATIASCGHIDSSVKKAVGLGLNVFTALRFATLNPARFYHKDDLGEVKEGFRADLVLLDSLDKLNVVNVLKDGIPLADMHLEQEKPFVNPQPNSVIFEDVRADRLTVPASCASVAIGLVEEQLLTKTVRDDGKGFTHKAVCVERYGKNGNVAACYVSGYDIHGGAVASSIAHDSHNVIAVGDNDTDIVLAINHLKEIGGGYVIAAGGKIADCLPLAYGGLMSTEPYETVLKAAARIEKTAHAMGVPDTADPFHCLSFLSLPVIPELRLLDTGLYDVLSGKFVGENQ